MTNFTSPISVSKQRNANLGAGLAVAGGALIVLLAIAFTIGALFLGAFIIFLNVQDIANNGVAFWPIFWIVLTSAVLFRGSISRGK